MEMPSSVSLIAHKPHIVNSDSFIIWYTLYNGIWIISSYQTEHALTVQDGFLEVYAKDISVKRNMFS